MGAREQLTFDEATHSYALGGRRVPGVTEILRPMVDFSAVPAAILAAKAELGRQVHLACELDDEADLDESSITDEIAPYLQAYRSFKRDTRALVLLNEYRVLEPMLLYAGTLDRVLLIEGQRWLVDIKTSIARPLAVGPQTAAYLRALDDASVTRRAALRLRPDKTYRFEPLTGADDWAAFMACLTLLRFKETHHDH